MRTDVIATLGPSGTCSEIIARRNLSKLKTATDVRLFATYEQAFEAVENDDAAAALVAAAYPRLNELVMKLSRSVVITSSFVDDTPALVICSKRFSLLELKAPGRTIACVSAPKPLLQALLPNCDIVPATSNADAARYVEDGRTDGALTTEPAALSLGLGVLHSFGEVPMAWVIFEKRQDDQQKR